MFAKGLSIINAIIIAIGIVLIFWAANWFYKYIVTRRLRSIGGEINADEFEENMRKAQIIDLRETNDFDGGHILGARSMPLTQFKDRMTGLRKDLPVYLYDTTGAMSIRAAQMLKKAGFQHVYWLKKGYADWSGKTKKNKY
ncbi:rhodanese-related sulfurtransferase [Lacticaseibacillus thailandensis DSM 22698 = JCM 13996]|uniref:Rhodanese-related sulfurtransferase n=1 Tax=Lacticaseibacillus thailandensis DSM 22698 = JCM 13996 TaxID=1423810 RepID=A0A0R2CAY6_9LACO|nr:rhodanese-related sulfurtransferase [Lacticaseibacillus thailandensis DSM 22698 = JCM 13996]